MSMIGSTTTGQLRHIPALDGLRGAAVAAVVLFHAGHLRGGYLGVDLFFVLSGFLITRILLAEFEHEGRIGLRRFYERRLRRLAPALIVMVGFVAICSPFLLDREVLGEVRASGIGSLFYVANWQAIWSGGDYWAALRGPNPFEHTWSLAIEEQVYLLWPLLLIVALRLRRQVLPGTVVLGVSLAGVLASFGANLYLVANGASEARLYYGTDTRIFAVMVGAFVGAMALRPAGRRVFGSTAAQHSGPVAAMVIVGSWFVVGGSDPLLHKGILLGLGIVAGWLLGVLAFGGRGHLARVLQFAPLRSLGAISYGLYLWHWPVFVVLTPARLGFGGWSLTSVRIGVSILLAVLSFLLIEQPARFVLPTRVLGRVLPTVAMAAVAALIGATWNVVAPVESAVGAVVVDGLAEPTLTEPVPVAPTVLSEVTTQVRPPKLRVIVIGDSQALHLAHPSVGPPVTQFTVASAAFLGCGIGPGFPTSGGEPIVKDLVGTTCGAVFGAWRRAIADFKPDVILLHVGAWELLDRRLGTSDVPFGTAEWDRATAEQIRNTNTVLGTGDAELVWLAAPCFDPVGERGGPPERSERERTARWNELLRQEADAQGITVLPYDEYTCTGPASDNDLNGDVFRSDGVHLTAEVRQTVWAWIASQEPFRR